MTTASNDLAIVMTGGGARAAYQVGVLRCLSRRLPDLEVPILTGVSAGAINAAFLASRPGNFQARTDDLTRLWSGLTVDQVFRVDAWSLIGHLLRWAVQLLFSGAFREARKVRGFVDTRPLARLLREVLRAEDGRIVGVEQNLESKILRAVAITTTNYATGQTIAWCEGEGFEAWERPKRSARVTDLAVQHVMASAALPMFFPAIKIEDDYYGDGGVRLSAPLAPAIHLGAGRILAISNRYQKTREEARARNIEGYPPPAQIAGLLLNAIFLDLLDQDADQLERVNRLIENLPEHERGELRKVDLMVFRPSKDLGSLAAEYEAQLPWLFRKLTRRLGTRETASPDFLSLLMFQPDYLQSLIALGEHDAEQRIDEIVEFLTGG